MSLVPTVLGGRPPKSKDVVKVDIQRELVPKVVHIKILTSPPESARTRLTLGARDFAGARWSLFEPLLTSSKKNF